MSTLRLLLRVSFFWFCIQCPFLYGGNIPGRVPVVEKWEQLEINWAALQINGAHQAPLDLAKTIDLANLWQETLLNLQTSISRWRKKRFPNDQTAQDPSRFVIDKGVLFSENQLKQSFILGLPSIFNKDRAMRNAPQGRTIQFFLEEPVLPTMDIQVWSGNQEVLTSQLNEQIQGDDFIPTRWYYVPKVPALTEDDQFRAQIDPEMGHLVVDADTRLENLGEKNRAYRVEVYMARR